jgi:hypothetical protein
LGDFEHSFGRQSPRALEQGGEILSLHELHREEDRLPGFADIEDSTHGGVGDLPRESYLVKDATAVRRPR